MPKNKSLAHQAYGMKKTKNQVPKKYKKVKILKQGPAPMFGESGQCKTICNTYYKNLRQHKGFIQYIAKSFSNLGDGMNL